jgi:predicted alternative tryptophan synthase beta-subunit
MQNSASQVRRVGTRLTTLILLLGLLFSGANAAFAGEQGRRLPDLARLPQKIRGEAAIQALGDKLPAVASAYNMTDATLRGLLQKDRDLWVDTSGRLLYVCEGMKAPVAPTPVAAPPTGPQAAPIPTTTQPIYHSRPGASRIIFLEFRGGLVSGTAWGGPFDCYAWSTDADYTTFSDAEQLAIKRVWQRIAEDYAPFDVDVTTDPSATGTKGVVMFTRDTCKDGTTKTPAAGYGGIAYLSVFGNSYYWPAWVSTDGTANQEQYMAAAGSHEMGHNLSLSHDGLTSPVTEYYNGHGSGDISWGPIMGSGYYSNVTQWSKGEYYVASRTEDDLAKIAGYLALRADDHGDTNAAATPLAVIAGTTIASTTPNTDPDNANPTNKGVIERSTDVDVWSFATAAGSITLNVNPWISPASLRGGNLDIRIELYDSSNALVASADPADRTYASITTTVALGTYYLHIMPVGTGTPLASPPTGYTVYGSLGQYFISGTVISTGVSPNMSVQGLAQTIPDGDVTPGTTDDTDFGSLLVSSSHDHVFTILNTGGTQLNLTGTPRVAIGGTNPGDFSVTAQPAAVVGSSGSTAFTIRFAPTALGVRTATVSIDNDDPDNDPYSFVIQGTGTPAPDINVQGNGVTIATGDVTPSATDYTDFGTVTVPPGTPITRTFTIQNVGTGPLSISGVTLTGAQASEFTVTTPPAGSVTAGGNTTFQVKFDPYTPGVSGVRSATVNVASNDPDENPYTFAIQGTVVQDTPTAALSLTTDVTAAGGTTTQFTVTYTDNTAVNVTTLDSNDVRVTGPGVFNQLATYVSNTGTASTRTVTYQITAPGGTWDFADNGTYNIWMEASQVADAGGLTVAAGLLGHFHCIIPNALYWAPMDTDPGWTLDPPASGSGWAYGTPQGGGDPTDRKCIGYNITATGVYPNSMSATEYARTPAINCTGFSTITLSFLRYLGTKNSDNVSVQVSTNGTTWSTVWNSSSAIGDTAWTTQTYDLSAWAANQATVYIRWGMGTTSVSQNNFGWNIDDVLVTGSGTLDITNPAATCTVANITTGGGTTYNFTVRYSDNAAVDVSDCDGNDVRVYGPNSYSALASFVNLDNATDGTPRTATYQIAAPGGTWDSGDNGTYSVYMLSGAVSDTSENYVSPGQLGSFAVSIAQTGGTIQFSSATYSVNENGGSVAVTATRTGGSTGAVSVSYATSNGTATAAADYTAASGTLSWADGDTANKTFTVTILDDTTYEGNETVILALSGPTGGASLGAQSTAALTIVDNDAGVTGVTSNLANGTYGVGQVVDIRVLFTTAVTVTGTPQITLETGASDAVVNYSSGSGSNTLVFNYTVAAGHASADLDYVATTSLALNGGTIKDGAGNNANVTLPAPGAAGSLGANKALVIDTTVPTVTNVTSNLANGTYGVGQVVDVRVTFSESVNVTGTPQITLETGTTDAVVNYSSGSGSNTLVFNYTVASGHTSADLDYVATTSLALNSGTIKDAGGNNATLTLPTPGAAGSLGANKAIVIDTTAPTVTNVTSNLSNGTYGVGQVVDVRVTFSESVTVTGTPQITLETGTSDAVVNYSSGSGTNTLVFNYTVAAGHTSADLDYVATTSLALNGGTIKDGAGNNATLTLPAPAAAGSLGANKAIVIDTTAPGVTSVTSNTANGTYTVSAVIDVRVVFSDVVNVTGTPQITLETGTTDAVVNYSSGSGSNTLVFNYTVAAGQTSADLDYVATTSLALAGGTIKDGAGNNATLTLPAPAAAGSLGANKAIVIDTTVPTVTNVTSNLANGTYGIGQVVDVRVVFSTVVNVTGTPQITLETGTSDAVVNYASGSGSNTLVFNYTVAAGHTSADLDYVATTSLALNGGTIKDAGGNNATLTLPTPGAAGSLGANKAIVIDTTAPGVTNVTSNTANGTYTTGAVIDVRVTFSDIVTVTGTPQITLETGTSDAVVNYASGSGSNTLVFNYTVASGHTSADLDYVATTSLALNGGTIKDGAGNNSNLTLPAPGAAGSLGANKAIVIDTTVPTVTNVTSNTANATYAAGAVIDVRVTFSESVTVTGTPQITLETGTSDAVVNYASGSGSNTLVFNYTVASGHASADLDYVATTSLALNGGTLKDAGGNNATLTLPTPGAAGSLGANKAIVIDTTAPGVTNVTSNTANGTYTTGAVIDVRVTFSDIVTVTGTPQITLETGTSDAVVNYASGSGSNTLVFNYTVASGHASADLDYVATTSLALNGGTIKDAGGNNANLTLPAPGAAGSLGANKAIVIDTTAPTVTNVTSNLANGTYGVGQVVDVRVTFSESVTVTGTPQITLETGTSDAVVNYSSGSGSNTLVFNYTVAAGHTSADLDYVATTSLALNGGTLKDAGGNNATLTLSTPGAAGSLGANKAIVIETTVPTVTNVTSNAANGTYAVGAVIDVRVTFSESVNVTGTPRITLETGASDAVVNYTSGSGTNTLV